MHHSREKIPDNVLSDIFIYMQQGWSKNMSISKAGYNEQMLRKWSKERPEIKNFLRSEWKKINKIIEVKKMKDENMLPVGIVNSFRGF